MANDEIIEDDMEIILSPLSHTFEEDGKSVEVEIYKEKNDSQWFLEVLDEYGNLLLNDEMFDSDEQALQQFKEDIKKNGIDSFIGINAEHNQQEEHDEFDNIGVKYKPSKAPDPDLWLSLDADERINMVQAYHKDIGDDVSEDQKAMHSLLHIVVENQIAEGEVAVAETVNRLVRQGLSRHESIHAVAAIVCEDIYDIFQNEDTYFDIKKYRRKLQKLTAKRWKKGQY